MVLPAHIPHLSLTEGVARLPLTARDILTRPTPAASSPSHPESAKTASSPRDAPCSRQGHSERVTVILPRSLVCCTGGG